MDHATHAHRSVSLRAFLVGLVFCLVIAAGEPYGVLFLRGSALAADFSTGAGPLPLSLAHPVD